MSRQNGIPPQLLRPVLVALVIVALYFTARYFMTPESFGQYGFYRGAALSEHANRPLTFAGMESCRECHEEVLELVSQFEHKTLNCETCHGPAMGHIVDNDTPLEAINDEGCMRCHWSDPSSPTWLRQISRDDHYESDGCVDCHPPHQPNE